jgi:hypothetical protein
MLVLGPFPELERRLDIEMRVDQHAQRVREGVSAVEDHVVLESAWTLKRVCRGPSWWSSTGAVTASPSDVIGEIVRATNRFADLSG